MKWEINLHKTLTETIFLIHNNMDIKPVGQLKPVDTGVKPVGQLKPIQSNLSPIGQLKEGDVNTVLPTYTTPQDLAVDSSIELLKQKGGRNGTTVLDSEWDVLKDVLKDSRATKEQREKAILTIQGYDAKHDDNNTMYYNKLEDNGVYVPTALAYGEKPPKGYKVASVWGNQKEADDDYFFTDLSKSLANGVLGAAQGVVDLAQVGTTLTTGEESKYLNKLGNTAEALKFKKDTDLQTPILNTEGVEKFSDLLDKDRFDLSPKALWGTFNMAAESLTEFAGLTKGAMTVMKNSPKAAIFAGSFASQLGDNLDNAEEAGLKGRDKAAVATAITAPMAALDAFYGLDGKLMSQIFQNEKRALLKSVIKSVEKDANGKITEQGFKELAKQATLGYTELAKRGVKEIVGDVLGEGGQESAQDFTQKAGEQLWDKMTPDERGQFGTDAFNAKSFGDYINSFATGLVSGAPMALGTQVLRSKHDEQSVNAYERVKQGPEAVKALKGDLDNALKNNDITDSEYEQANFKIDAYQKYNEETKNVNLKPEDEKKAFELSFQIQGLKTEIPTNENEISKLDPIARAKVESKQKQAKELQSELNDIIRQGEIKGEPVVPKKEEERVQKEKEKAQKESEKESKVETKPKEPRIPKVKTVEVKSEYEPIKAEEDKRTYAEVTPDEFNENKFPSRSRHRMLRKELSDVTKYPKGEVAGKLMPREYTYKGETKTTYKVKLQDGKEIRLSSSMMRPEGFRGHMRTERLKGNAEGMPVAVKVIDLNNPTGGPTEEGYKAGKKVLKIYDKVTGKFLSWAKETHKGETTSLDKNKESLYTPEQIEQIKDLELIDEEPASEAELTEIRKPITVKERAEKATKKIVEESKEKVKQSKEKENEKRESAVKSKESIRGNNEETSGEDKDISKETKLRTSKSRIQRKIKNPLREKAAKITVDSPYDLVMQHFIGGGYMDRDSLKSFFKGKESEAFARQNLTLKLDKYDPKYAPNMKDLAHSLWEDNQEQYPKFTTEDYFNALEEVLLQNTSPIQMANDLITKTETPSMNRQEELLAGIYEEEGIKSEVVDNIIDFLEIKTDEELKALADKDKWEEGVDIILNKVEVEPFQKVSQRKGDITKVIDAIKKALPKINVVEGDLGTNAGKVSADGKTITINPNYAGLDTPIHEAGHILIDSIGYNNRIVQAAIKQLKATDLYKETKERYSELSDEELDKEVLSEAIGREGADIFDKVENRSKFKAYLDYIFDWLKQKLGMDKNIAKSLAKQIIGGVKTKSLEGKAGKEQLQKESKKNPLGARSLKFEQYAAEHGFSYEKETEKVDEASYLLSEAQEEYDIAKENAEAATTDEEAEPLEEILAEKETALNAAKKNFAVKGKRTFEYKKYKKDFNAIQKLMAEKELSDYTTEELQDLISMLHGFDNKAAKAVRNDAMIKLAMILTKKQQENFKGMEGYIESLSKTKDISPLQTKILHHSHFSENNLDIQAASLAFGNAVMDKITDANTKKATHEKLATKVIAEENKKLGIVGAAANRFSSDSAKYFNWMENEKGELLTVEEAKAKGLSEAKINYLKFTRETIADYKGTLEENDFENAVMDAIRIDKSFMEAYKSEGLLPAFSYYLGGGANNLGKVRFVHNGQIKSYAEVEKEILASADRKSISGMAKALWELLVANIQARRQLKKGFNVDEKENPLEVKGEAEYSLNEKGQLVSKFDKPRAKDRGYSKDFYKAMNQFIDESAHTKHISKIMPLVDSVEYLNKNGYTDEGYVIKPNVAKWIDEWKKLQIFKEPHVNDPIIDAAVKAMRNLVASTTMWFNVPANVMNVFMGNYNSWRQENGKTLAIGNKRLFGGSGKNRAYGLDIVKKYSIVNQDFDSQPTIKAGSILSKLATLGTQLGEYQIQGSLGLGLMNDKDFESFEYTKDKYGNEVLTVKPGVDEKALKERMTQVKNRVTDIQGKYPEEDRRNILRGEFGKAAFQFKVWIPDYLRERLATRYINAYGVEKEGNLTKLARIGAKEMYADLKKGDFKSIMKNKAFMSNLKGMMTIGTLLALSQGFDDEEDKKKKGGLSWSNALSQVLFLLDLEQDKYLVSNPAAALGKTKDLISAFEALVTADEEAWNKVKRVLPANKITNAYELGKKIID